VKVEDALAWAREGWRVFPVRNKKPLVKDFRGVASVDETVIRKWWRKWPDADPAWPVHHGVIVVDLDGGTTPVDAEIYLGFALPATRTHRTPSGGWHLFYFVGDVDAKNSASELGPGIDVRAAGGYIVLPAAGNGYTVEREK